MKVGLIVVVVFACAVCFTEAQLPTPTFLNTSINSSGCGSTKLCVSSVPGCNPSGNSSCFFSSTQLNNGVGTVEISGPTSGYVGLGLVAATKQIQQIPQGTSVVFVCGNNNTAPSGSFFFQVAIPNGPTLTTFTPNVSILNITSIQGSTTGNQNLIQCTFNVNLNSTITQLPFNVTILTGNTSGTVLGNASTVFTSNGPLDLANPMSNTLNINNSLCNNTKLCVSNPSNCNPAVDSNCFFSSVQSQNQSFFFELSGTTAGYLALALSKQGSPTVAFICGNNNTANGSSFIFQPATFNTTLIPATVNTVNSIQGIVVQNPTLVQCIFNTSSSFSVTTRGADTSYVALILSGTINGTDFGIPNVEFNSTNPLDLTDPNALNDSSSNLSISHWIQVLAVLLSALTLHFL